MQERLYAQGMYAAPSLRSAFAALLLTGAHTLGLAAGDTAAPDYTHLREARAQSLTAPDGWFSLVALQSLAEGDTTVGSAPGNTVVLAHVAPHLLTLHRAGKAITLTAVDPALQLGGHPAVVGTVVSDAEDTEHALGSAGVLLWAIDRGGQRYLRVKDPAAPARLHFHGVRWYAPSASYRITAKWLPYPADHTLAITNKLGQVTQEQVPGYAEFTLAGQTLRLTPTVENGHLFFVFRDTTGRLTTDGGGRFLSTPMPSNGPGAPGTLLLDFNLAVNPPCAYSPYATCPLAPRENRLAISIPAGEKRYDE